MNLEGRGGGEREGKKIIKRDYGLLIFLVAK